MTTIYQDDRGSASIFGNDGEDDREPALGLASPRGGVD